ncbi:hypothetical protein GCM10023213_26210 [Prosthecobacter algae]|uniref:Uncharacterized protein n=1 Tax=Prosthecobacter algae TaxID=1144682 RepID=A0ABP9PA00_9BACT
MVKGIVSRGHLARVTPQIVSGPKTGKRKICGWPPPSSPIQRGGGIQAGAAPGGVEAAEDAHDDGDGHGFE